MAIETFEFIDDLNAANPTATDNVSEGDDHLRGLKTTLKNTFPNVTGAITATETELNYVDGVTSNIQTQLGTKLESETSHADVLVDGDVGTTANKLVQLNASAELPAVSGANLTGIDTGANAALSNLSGVTGTSGQIMTSDGAGNATMQDAAGGGAWTLIQEQEVTSSVTSVDFTTNITNAYGTYVLILSNVIGATNTIYVTLSSNAGASYDTASNYRVGVEQTMYDNSAGTPTRTGGGRSAFDLGESRDADSRVVFISGLANTSTATQLRFAGISDTGSSIYDIRGVGYYSPTTVMNGIRIVIGSGITGGTLSLFGISNT